MFASRAPIAGLAVMPSRHVLVPGTYGVDDQGERARSRSGESGVFVAECDPFDIARGIGRVLTAPLSEGRSTAESRPGGAWQIAALLEVMSGA